MRTEQRLALGSVGAALVLAVLAAVSVISIRSLIHHQRWVAHTEEVIAATNDLLTTIVDAEAGQRGYILTGQERFLEPFERAARERHGKLERLRRLTADNPEQAGRLEALRLLLDRRLRYLQVTIDLRRAGKPDEAVAIVAGGRGKALMDRIRSVVKEIRGEEESLLLLRSARAESHAWTGLLLVGALGSSGVLMLLIAGSRIRRDLSNWRRVDEQVREMKETLAAVVDASPLPIIGLDAAGRIIVWNPGAERLFGWSSQEVVGKPLPFAPAGKGESPMQLFQRVRKGESLSQVEVTRRARDGTPVVLSLSAGPLHGADGGFRGAMAVMEDIRERKQLEEQRDRDAERLHALSLTDELTGLHNRRGFQLLGARSLETATATGSRVLLVYMDLDHLKVINDQLGHAQGDRALCEVAAVLRESFRESDVLARLGGDEFATLAVVRGEGDAEFILARVRERLVSHNSLPGRRYPLSLSIGLALSEPGAALGDLLSEADAQMYVRKHGRPPSPTQKVRQLQEESPVLASVS